MFAGYSQLVPKINNNEQQIPTSQTHIKRPMNPFILWSSEKRKEIAKENPKLHNTEISKQLGEEWKTLPQEERQKFIDRSNQLREEHKKRYPNYKYCSRKKNKSENASGSINPQLVPPNNYANGQFNLCVGYLNGIPFSSGYACSSCWMPFTPMTPFHHSSIQHPRQTSSHTYYSDTEPSTTLMPANTDTGPHNAFVSANTATGPHNAFVSANTALMEPNTTTYFNNNQSHDLHSQ